MAVSQYANELRMMSTVPWRVDNTWHSKTAHSFNIMAFIFQGTDKKIPFIDYVLYVPPHLFMGVSNNYLTRTYRYKIIIRYSDRSDHEEYLCKSQESLNRYNIIYLR